MWHACRPVVLSWHTNCPQSWHKLQQRPPSLNMLCSCLSCIRGMALIWLRSTPRSLLCLKDQKPPESFVSKLSSLCVTVCERSVEWWGVGYWIRLFPSQRSPPPLSFFSSSHLIPLLCLFYALSLLHTHTNICIFFPMGQFVSCFICELGLSTGVSCQLMSHR